MPFADKLANSLNPLGIHQWPCPDRPGIQLYLIDLLTPLPANALACLDEQERARAARFHFPQHARRHLASHVALRQILSAETGLPTSMRLDVGPHGKPLLDVSCPLHFNMSHSEDWALVAVSPAQPLGVDLESLGRDLSAQDLAQRTLTPTEYQAWLSLPPEEQAEAFLQAWTRKEASLKAMGLGLGVEPNVVDSGLGPQAQDLTVWDEGQAHHLTVFNVALPIQALAAVAVLKD